MFRLSHYNFCLFSNLLFFSFLKKRPLQYHAASAALLMIARQEALPCRRFKHIVDAFASERGAFEIFLGRDPLTDLLAFVRREELLRAFPHLFLGDRVLP